MVKKLLQRGAHVDGTDKVSLISCHGTIMSWYYHVMVLSPSHAMASVPVCGVHLYGVTFYVACTDVDIAISMDHKSEFGRGRREKWGMGVPRRI